jgi:hypothetical protein
LLLFSIAFDKLHYLDLLSIGHFRFLMWLKIIALKPSNFVHSGLNYMVQQLLDSAVIISPKYRVQRVITIDSQGMRIFKIIQNIQRTKREKI